MKIWQSGLLSSLSMGCLAALLAFSGCESVTEEDSSGVTAYLDAHPYTSATRTTPLATVLKISPVQATANMVGQTIAFTASGGSGAFHWGVSDSTVGSIASGGADQAIYTCLIVGYNDVIVQDDTGHYASAHISPVDLDTLSISPASVTLDGGDVNASFTVSGGTPPYSWTSGNTALGTVTYDTSSSHLAAYKAVAGVYGQNVVTVTDAKGRKAYVTITQAE